MNTISNCIYMEIFILGSLYRYKRPTKGLIF